MVQCSETDCNTEATQRCSRCKERVYCSVECQAKDWPTHKTQCKKVAAQPGAQSNSSLPPGYMTGPLGSMSMLGTIYNPMTGVSTPASSKSHFFADMFGYKADCPERVYSEIVDTYRIFRSGEYLQGTGPSSMSFEEFVAKAEKSGILPDWWKEENRDGLLKFSKEDEWGKLERQVTKEDIKNHLDKPARMLSLEMMIERINNQR
ncbi:uncharacterized protein EV420DRAFT_427992 [Desarmillaria tabescens]|uniref:MYND-type domain-containing protein n=1 Tax=Armillaria tabescens TaxID=1929756 RepID=A0AA39U680_ARMTA|nr:uncharacterized protein EV420DRAFT_427992 [Desarmillaria tabescens]KAK0467790.1 hypothetical protein EV420DRAFT_427992 [Desarmillaria tabescens]